MVAEANITLEQIREVLGAIWTSMLGLPLREARDECEATGASRWTSAIHISGAWSGTVLLLTTEPFARRAAAIMLDCRADNISSADAQDVVAELANMIGGGIKGLLPGPAVLSLPSVTYGSHYAIRVPRTRLAACVEYSCGAEPLSVRVLEARMANCDLS